MSRFTGTGLVLATALLGAACSGEIRESENSDGLYFSLASPEIGKLVTPNNVFCSGTLITQSVVLTAAHCTRELRAPITFEVDGPDGGGSVPFPVARSEFNPDYVDGSYVHDVALMKLRDSVPSELAVARKMTSAGIPNGTAMTVWGYSSKATSNQGDTQKHYARFEWPMKTTLVWFGDSGGPVIRSDSGEIARVVSGILDNSYVAIDLSAPLTANWEWIQNTLALIQ